MNAKDRVQQARDTLLDGSGKLTYFERRGISEETVRDASLGYADGELTYPSIAKDGRILGIHYKDEKRNSKGKRRQRWGSYAKDLPPKGHSKKPGDPAKVIPFGLETLKHLEPGSLVVLCCGEEDALSLRQAGYTALSQPGAGLLEPVYAREFAGLEVVVFYDAGEESGARKDALKLLEAGARSVRVVVWPSEASNGADVNGMLVADQQGFKSWGGKMISDAPALATVDTGNLHREGEPDTYTADPPEVPAWPVLGEDARHGLPGEILEAIEPHTEADPVAVLANLLAAFGNAVGRGAYLRVGADRHHLNLDVALVGETAKGRKGISWGQVRDLMGVADKEWIEDRVLGGLSSGEGLIHAVRDRVTKLDKDGELTTTDEGIKDKRLLVMEGEFARVLKVMTREGNTLSPIIRQAWDGGRLQVMTRNNPLRATDSHISIVGHVTKAELLKHLAQTETANGFANRFMWLMVKRSKILPFGGDWQKVDTAWLVRGLRSALEFGRKAGEIHWGKSAKELWVEVYGPLSEGAHGLFGAVVGRAEAQVVRLATVYAVMDRSLTIESEHLKAALAFWGYAEESARYIFGDATGDREADQILKALKAANAGGMSRTDIRDLFGRHKDAGRIGQALDLLLKIGRVRREVERTSGRPGERWFAT